MKLSKNKLIERFQKLIELMPKGEKYKGYESGIFEYDESDIEVWIASLKREKKFAIETWLSHMEVANSLYKQIKTGKKLK